MPGPEAPMTDEQIRKTVVDAKLGTPGCGQKITTLAKDGAAGIVVGGVGGALVGQPGLGAILGATGAPVVLYYAREFLATPARARLINEALKRREKGKISSQK